MQRLRKDSNPGGAKHNKNHENPWFSTFRGAKLGKNTWSWKFQGGPWPPWPLLLCKSWSCTHPIIYLLFWFLHFCNTYISPFFKENLKNFGTLPYEFWCIKQIIVVFCSWFNSAEKILVKNFLNWMDVSNWKNYPNQDLTQSRRDLHISVYVQEIYATKVSHINQKGKYWTNGPLENVPPTICY